MQHRVFARTSLRAPRRRLLGVLAGRALVFAAACDGDDEEAPTRRPVLIERFPPSETYPNGHFEVRRPSGEPVAGALELWVSEVAEDGEPTGRRARRADGEPAPPVVGKLHRTEPVVVFEPRFPLRPRTWYEAVFTPRDGSPRNSLFVRVPAPPLEPETRVAAVYPSADRLPENLLRFYVQFSGPMRRGEAYDHVHLFDAAGDVVEGVLVKVEPELWDPETTRLTLLLDPGRIKRGLEPLEELGPNLEQEGSYVLRVDQPWRDAAGASLIAGFEKRFVVVEADRVSPDPDDWSVGHPAPGTREPLRVEFDEPLDRALLERMLFVEDAEGNVVRGVGRALEGETGWEYVPDEAWGVGEHELVVDPLLEDRAGNGLRRLFDEEVAASGDEQPEPEAEEEGQPIRLPFELVPTDAD